MFYLLFYISLNHIFLSLFADKLIQIQRVEAACGSSSIFYLLVVTVNKMLLVRWWAYSCVSWVIIVGRKCRISQMRLVLLMPTLVITWSWWDKAAHGSRRVCAYVVSFWRSVSMLLLLSIDVQIYHLMHACWALLETLWSCSVQDLWSMTNLYGIRWFQSLVQLLDFDQLLVGLKIDLITVRHGLFRSGWWFLSGSGHITACLLPCSPR